VRVVMVFWAGCEGADGCWGKGSVANFLLACHGAFSPPRRLTIDFEDISDSTRYSLQ